MPGRARAMRWSARGAPPAGAAVSSRSGAHRRHRGATSAPCSTRIGDREAEVGVPLEIQLVGQRSRRRGDQLQRALEPARGRQIREGDGPFLLDAPARAAGHAGPADVRGRRRRPNCVIRRPSRSASSGAGMGSGGAPKLDPDRRSSLPVAGRPYSLQLEASDPNGDALTYTMRDAEGARRRHPRRRVGSLLVDTRGRRSRGRPSR
jgi:hypothetical protein